QMATADTDEKRLAGNREDGEAVGPCSRMSLQLARRAAFDGGHSGRHVSPGCGLGSPFQLAAALNADISAWDVSQVTTMNGLFDGASAFDQSLGGWNITAVTDMDHMLDNSGLSDANYDATLIGWAAQSVQSGVPLGADGHSYC